MLGFSPSTFAEQPTADFYYWEITPELSTLHHRPPASVKSKRHTGSQKKTIQASGMAATYKKEFPLLSGNKSLGPVLTRLNTFLRPKLIRNMVAQKKGINFEDVINNKKIFLGKLSQGLIGEENSYLLGTMLVSKINQTIMARQAISKEKRQDYFLYIDEFHNFVTPSLAAMLSGVRKYHLGLILVHQESRQIQKRDTEVAHSIMANPATRICFRLGDSDAQNFQSGFSYFEKEDLQNLGIGQAIMRIERAQNDFNLTVPLLQEIPAEVVKEKTETIIASSRKKYGMPKEEIEKILSRGVTKTVHQDEIRAKSEPEKEKKSKESLVNLKTKELPSDDSRDNKSQAEKIAPKLESKIEIRDIKEDHKQDLPSKSKNISESKKEIQTSPEIKPDIPQDTSKPTPSSKQVPIEEGKGGAQHRYLQSLIKRVAEDNGFSATIEQQMLEGLGSVDICLNRDKKQFAVELSVSTNETQELSNLQKCLTADFEKIILCSEDENKLEKTKALIKKELNKQEQAKILFLTPQELFSFIEQETAKSLSTEKRVKGDRVKVNFKPVGEQEKKQKREAISKVIVDAMKRMENEK